MTCAGHTAVPYGFKGTVSVTINFAGRHKALRPLWPAALSGHFRDRLIGVGLQRGIRACDERLTGTRNSSHFLQQASPAPSQ